MKRYSISLLIRDFELELQTNMIDNYGTDNFRTSDDLPSPWVWGETTTDIDWQEQYLHMYALVETQWRQFFSNPLKLQMPISLGPANSLLILFPTGKPGYLQMIYVKRQYLEHTL